MLRRVTRTLLALCWPSRVTVPMSGDAASSLRARNRQNPSVCRALRQRSTSGAGGSTPTRTVDARSVQLQMAPAARRGAGEEEEGDSESDEWEEGGTDEEEEGEEEGEPHRRGLCCYCCTPHVIVMIIILVATLAVHHLRLMT